MILTVILLTLGFLSLGAGITSILSWIQIRSAYHGYTFKFYSPKVGVIVPCKGKDKRFRGNIKAICNQDYENYRVVFVVDSKRDAAYKLLEKMTKEYNYSKLVISKPRRECSGKISALLRGIEELRDVDIYIFADSDIRPHKKWIKYLIAPLEDESIGATTGYRWYFPHNLWTLSLSSWNACTIATLFLGKLNFAWGGSTAIKRKVFEALNIEERWKKSLSDDLVLTAALREKNYTIKFVPQCIVECFEDKNLYELVKWSTRQNVWTKWYYPSLWRISFIGAVTLKTLNLVGLVLMIHKEILIGFLLFSPVILDFFKGWQQLITFKKFMLYPKKKFGSTIAYMCISTLTPFLIAYNLLLSAFIREVEWRGHRYRFRDLEIQTIPFKSKTPIKKMSKGIHS